MGCFFTGGKINEKQKSENKMFLISFLKVIYKTGTFSLIPHPHHRCTCEVPVEVV